MRPETGFERVEPQLAALNRHLDGATPQEVLAEMAERHAGRLALVSSFGAESVVLLHMVAELDPGLPVLFLETEMLFPETLAYQREVAAGLGLTGIRSLRPDAEALELHDPAGDLHRSDPDLCCHLRKTEPLERALAGFGAWVTGRKRHQTRERQAMHVCETDEAGRVKINPLHGWGRDEVAAYIERHDLPRHPLVSRGYPSIGCAPCTSRVAPGEDPRAGRWRGQDKQECGIHLVNGRFVRMGAEGAA
ncbi:phosphoadenylyl-sulfate reductase [Rhodovulum sulfidophilum]|uniref:phosphoadenylyl-sulfate reductase n=1 Tax=Rhodovulum sulfidophilum TaxID=35806 RepID=UPI001389B386|nr:phosphoadenylyl-sulfate reductase [Rhodovulum sulfidophilum]NDK34704.1 phosphoadenylyl-sulfate reductase [Rhodovulum sulfidophilum]